MLASDLAAHAVFLVAHPLTTTRSGAWVNSSTCRRSWRLPKAKRADAFALGLGGRAMCHTPLATVRAYRLDVRERAALEHHIDGLAARAGVLPPARCHERRLRARPRGLTRISRELDHATSARVRSTTLDIANLELQFSLIQTTADR